MHLPSLPAGAITAGRAGYKHFERGVSMIWYSVYFTIGVAIAIIAGFVIITRRMK